MLPKLLIHQPNQYQINNLCLDINRRVKCTAEQAAENFTTQNTESQNVIYDTPLLIFFFFFLSISSLIDVLRQPLEPISISHLPDNAAHEDLKRPDIGLREVDLSLAGCEVSQAQTIAQLVF